MENQTPNQKFIALAEEFAKAQDSIEEAMLNAVRIANQIKSLCQAEINSEEGTGLTTKVIGEYPFIYLGANDAFIQFVNHQAADRIREVSQGELWPMVEMQLWSVSYS